MPSAEVTAAGVAWWTHPDWWVAIGTFGLALVTGVLAYYTYQLWSDARQSSDQRTLETRQALEIASVTAKATEASVQSARRMEGPFLVVLDAMFPVQDFIGAGQPFGNPTFIFRLLNAGRTPAFVEEVKSAVWIAPVNDGQPGHIGEFDPHRAAAPQAKGMFLQAGQKKDGFSQFALRVNAAQMQSARANTHAFFLKVAVRFSDIFGDQHEMKTLLRYDFGLDDFLRVGGSDQNSHV